VGGWAKDELQSAAVAIHVAIVKARHWKMVLIGCRLDGVGG
jgi:hypothetical protein